LNFCKYFTVCLALKTFNPNFDLKLEVVSTAGFKIKIENTDPIFQRPKNLQNVATVRRTSGLKNAADAE